MARTRTTKKLAQRIDLNYFKRPTPFKRAKLLLSFIVPLVAAGWIGWRGFAHDSRVYSSGRMSEAHAVLDMACGTLRNVYGDLLLLMCRAVVTGEAGAVRSF